MKDHKIVIFGIGDNLYGVDISNVKEIVPMSRISAVPGRGLGVLGVTSLRGLIVPVVSLASRLGIPESRTDSSALIMVIESNGTQIGCVVDEVNQVMSPGDNVKPLPPSLESCGSYLKGVVDTEAGLVILVDLAALTFDNAA